MHIVFVALAFIVCSLPFCALAEDVTQPGRALTNKELSSIPPWVNYEASTKTRYEKEFGMREDFLSSKPNTAHQLFAIKQKPGRVLYSYVKAEDRLLGAPPTARDRDKEFFSPIEKDFNPLDRDLLRVRPTVTVGSGFRVTFPTVNTHRVKIIVGKEF